MDAPEKLGHNITYSRGGSGGGTHFSFLNCDPKLARGIRSFPLGFLFEIHELKLLI